MRRRTFSTPRLALKEALLASQAMKDLKNPTIVGIIVNLVAAQAATLLVMEREENWVKAQRKAARKYLCSNLYSQFSFLEDAEEAVVKASNRVDQAQEGLDNSLGNVAQAKIEAEKASEEHRKASEEAYAPRKSWKADRSSRVDKFKDLFIKGLQAFNKAKAARAVLAKTSSVAKRATAVLESAEDRLDSAIKIAEKEVWLIEDEVEKYLALAK